MVELGEDEERFERFMLPLAGSATHASATCASFVQSLKICKQHAVSPVEIRAVENVDLLRGVGDVEC